MKIFSELKKATGLLSKYEGQWAIAGGIAASIYRSKPRFTDDIDFALIDGENGTAAEIAEEVILKLGYQVYKGFVPHPLKNNQQILGLLCARTSEHEKFVGLDFLLPEQFWIKDAVELAQSNKIDYGFADLATVTPEHLILAKISAVQSNPQRYQDLDDITEILKSVDVDVAIINQMAESYGLTIKKEVSVLLANDS